MGSSTPGLVFLGSIRKYKCGSPTNRWSILCGKQNGQIEGCVIHIRTKK